MSAPRIHGNSQLVPACRDARALLPDRVEAQCNDGRLTRQATQQEKLQNGKYIQLEEDIADKRDATVNHGQIFRL